MMLEGESLGGWREVENLMPSPTPHSAWNPDRTWNFLNNYDFLCASDIRVLYYINQSCLANL